MLFAAMPPAVDQLQKKFESGFSYNLQKGFKLSDSLSVSGAVKLDFGPSLKSMTVDEYKLGTEFKRNDIDLEGTYNKNNKGDSYELNFKMSFP